MKSRFSQTQITLAITTIVFVALFFGIANRHTGIASPQSVRLFLKLLSDNAFIGIAAFGMTFVILSGGIDLSVGSIIGFTTVFVAVAIEEWRLHPVAAVIMAMALGAIFGCVMGCIVHFFELAPFLVTLAGMFLARGLALVLCNSSIAINHAFFRPEWEWGIQLAPRVSFVAQDIVLAAGLLAAWLIAIAILSLTPFGRNTYALGGNEQSAVLMGLPVGRTKIGVYTLSGFCSALAGLFLVFQKKSGDPLNAVGLELDAIAAVVIGGTLLTGGVGHVGGTLIGVLILGIIQTAVTLEGFNSWWTRIAIGILLLAFVVLQRLLSGGMKLRLRFLHPPSTAAAR